MSVIKYRQEDGSYLEMPSFFMGVDKEATSTSAGLMSAEDKTKLDSFSIISSTVDIGENADLADGTLYIVYE